jgi:hypothetical protein
MSVRRMLLLAVLFVAAAVSRAATVTFTAPLPGAQVLGPTLLEVTSDAASDAAAIERVDFFVDGVLAGVARKAPYRIAFDFGTSLAPRTITAKAWSNGFRTSDSATITTAALTANDSINIDLVEVPLRARSSKPLRAADLRVRENGVEQTVRDVQRSRPAAHFAFIVDRSLSMNGGKLEGALHAIESELRQLRDGDTASLVLFNHHVAKARPITRGQQLMQQLDRRDLLPSGGTSLRDAVASVASTHRTYAIVITDGGDRTSALSDELALQKISTTKTIVNALVLGDSHTRFLDRAAGNTGGSVVSASSASLRDALARLLTDINSRYLVIYQSTATTRGWRTIEVTARIRDVTVSSARKGYFAE